MLTLALLITAFVTLATIRWWLRRDFRRLVRRLADVNHERTFVERVATARWWARDDRWLIRWPAATWVMIILTSLLFSAQTPQHRLIKQPNLPRQSFAYFEAFPASGGGTTGPCSASAPTGAKGEAITFTRATAATCTTGTNGTRTVGIGDGALVEMSSGQIRQELDGDGVVGFRKEAAATNLLLRFIAIDNAAWADVGTPTLTTGQTSPFVGTYATAAVQIDDNDGAAFEGRSQAVTVSAGAAHTMHCYVKAGTVAEARISLDGTTADITGLSSSWSIVTVTDASSSGVSISAQVLAGDAAGDTGTVIFGGCQVETGSARTSINPTVGTSVTRNVEVVSFAPTWPNSASICVIAYYTGPTPVSSAAGGVLEFTGFTSALNESGGNWRWFSGGVGQVVAITSSLNGVRTYGWHTGTTRGMGWGANTAGPTADVNAANKFGATLSFGGPSANPLNGIISRVLVDPDRSRCPQ